METAIFVVSVLLVLSVVVGGCMVAEQVQTIGWLRESNTKLLAACKALCKHATAVRDVGANPGGDYHRELSKMITEAETAIGQAE